jgi:hypothetical protein
MVVNIVNISDATNRIIYNRLLRAVRKILMFTVCEMNDSYTRNKITTDIVMLLKRAKTHAIKDYEFKMLDFDPTKPHYVEIHIVI